MIRLLLAMAVTGLLLSGCNTMRGFGEDMSAAGHALSNSATTTERSPSTQPSQ